MLSKETVKALIEENLSFSTFDADTQEELIMSAQEAYKDINEQDLTELFQ